LQDDQQSRENEITPEHPATWQIAASMCARFHRNQWRKDKITPYDAHPFRVAMTVRHVFGVDDEATLAAALLHDVIEDTAADFEDVESACGSEVAEIVAALTKDMSKRENVREPAYDKQLAIASWKAHIVKLADVFDNVCDSNPGRVRQKALSKAPRAIAIADRSEPRVERAVAALEALVARVQAVENSP